MRQFNFTRIGQLLMEDLVAMHLEFKQFFGPDGAGFPKWMRLDEIELLHDTLKDILMGENGAVLGGWQPLYSAADVKDCIQKFKTLKYAEEACYNDTFVIKAFSSGLEIGASSWTLNGPRRSITYLPSSIFESAHAMSFNYNSLRGNDLIMFSDLSSLQGGMVGTGDDVTARRDISVSRIFKSEVPIFMISTVAEELLAYTNIVPEWLCNQRQENLYSGDALFCHVELIKAKKLHVFPAIHSIDFLNLALCLLLTGVWRLGPVVHLLRRWCGGDPNSLLVLEQEVDADLALLPFKPVLLKLPEVLRLKLPISESRSHSVLYYYSENETQSIPSSRKDFEISLTTNLAFQLRPIMMKQESIAIARLKGKLIVDHGNFELDIVKEPDKSSMRQMSPQSGSLDLNILLAALQTKGINGSLQQEADKVGMIQVYEPEKALIEVHAMHTIVSADDETLAALLFEVVSNVLNGN
ncbi:hypothetical protein IFM89_028136 [Coptis chinensis]|uniref:Uncharacterized protein n=1 Tax=Coptis chinensis TaxID=261450 RepID=A0A835LTA4_9MAGN|nr:hypothetical protein IFM89_028136 [Coptis chinensis]